jgi:DNA repair exonuclease SbcCD ATPase subunit
VLQTGLAAAFGFCAALFLVLLLAPAIARRISELTWRHSIRVLPQSSEEIAASRDHLRGQNAIEMRQLEMKMETVAEKERQLRIGKQGFEDIIATLTGDLDQTRNTVKQLEGEGARLARDLNTAVQNNAMLSTENADRDVRLATLSAEFSHLRNDHARQVAAFGLMEEAHRQAEQRLELVRTEASTLRSKVSIAESEVRMARTEAKRHEGDVKLANRKIAALEGKLERSIRLMAEAEEKLERREGELKRLKEQGGVAVTARNAASAQNSKPAVSRVITAAQTAKLAEPKPVVSAPSAIKSEPIVAQISQMRPSLRAANIANAIEKARLKTEMMDLAGRVTAEAAVQNSNLKEKILALRPDGSDLTAAILKHAKELAE